MKFKFQDKTYRFPSALSEIKLRQRIEFNNLYGKEILKRQDEIFEKDEEGNYKPKDQTEAVLHVMDVACKNFSFFSGIPLEDVQQIPIEQVMNVYHSCFDVISKQENEMKFSQKHYFKNELWTIESPEINYESKMTFNEFITAKQIVKTMADLGEGQWEALPSLCAIFLRKEDEAFDEKFISGQTSRVQDMMDLPLDIALNVAFFLGISMISYSKITRYSKNDLKEGMVPTWQTISTSGDGSVS